jgi:hypothetical protein
VGCADETTFCQTDLDPTLLRSGTNVFAVEVHQASRSSSDIAFDLELLGTAAALPPTPPNPPNLSWALAGQALKLTWPEGPADWKVYSTAELGPNSFWTVVNGPVSKVNGQNQVTIVPAKTRFYRLGSPP